MSLAVKGGGGQFFGKNKLTIAIKIAIFFTCK